MEKWLPPYTPVHSTAPAYQNNRVIVSARDATTTTYVAHAFSFRQFRVIVTLVPVMLSMAPVCVTRSGTNPVAMPIVLEYSLP